MANWLYRLKIKDLLLDEEPEEGFDAYTIKIAKTISERILALMEKVKNADNDKVGDLYYRLDEIKDLLDDIVSIEPEDAQDDLNEALFLLYEVGDRWHRIWIG